MATKLNNRRLILVFVVLIAVFFIVRYLNSSKTKGNFDPNVISLDTAAISEILLYPKVTDHEEIRLFQEGGKWMVQKGDFTSMAMESTVNSLINAIQNIKPTRLAARSEDKWEKFQVNDSLATKVKVVYNDGEDLGIMIGKFSYKQTPQTNPYQQQQMKTLSYFRRADQNEVYATEGFLTMTFNRDINAFRDQTFIKSKKEDVRKLDFNLPGEESYTLQRIDSTWMIEGDKADDNKVEELLSKLAMNNQNQFADDFNAEGEANYSLKIEGDNMDPIIIKSYSYDSATVVMQSSLNQEAMFKIPRTGLFNDLFKGPELYRDSLQFTQ